MAVTSRGRRRSNRARCRRARTPGGESYPKLQWVGYELDSPIRLISFMRQIAKDAYTSKLGPRQVGALNGAVRNLMEAYGIGDYRLEEMAKRIAALEKAFGAGRSPKEARIRGISTPISEN
jgi:hypothetical protein